MGRQLSLDSEIYQKRSAAKISKNISDVENLFSVEYYKQYLFSNNDTSSIKDSRKKYEQLLKQINSLKDNF